MEIIPYDGEIFYDNLGMRLWERRHQILDQYIDSTKLLEIGCNEGKFIVRQSHSTDMDLIVGLDIDSVPLNQAINVFEQLIFKNIMGDGLQECIKFHRKKPCLVKLFQGDAFIKYQELKNLDFQVIISLLQNKKCICMVELIEHVYLEQLPLLCENVFGFLNAPKIIVTTPNSDFNYYFKLKDPNFKFRHPDHKYEFTQEEFKQWAIQVSQQYNYDVIFDGVGVHKSGDMQFGYASQIAIFSRKGQCAVDYQENNSELITVFDYQLPFDGRSEIQKQVDNLVCDYNRFNVQNLDDITEQEWDIILQMNENEILIRNQSLEVNPQEIIQDT
ncbi:hypothetical protein pb186bvf_011492 [Paramecium bursaria]